MAYIFVGIITDISALAGIIITAHCGHWHHSVTAGVDIMALSVVGSILAITSFNYQHLCQHQYYLCWQHGIIAGISIMALLSA